MGIEKVSASLFLSRIPIVTPELTAFEKAYYNYQNELQQRLMWTFPHYYYFKKSSLAEKNYVDRQKFPLGKQDGVWYPKGVPDVRHNRERRTKQEVNLNENEDHGEFAGEKKNMAPITPNSRETEADRAQDLKSLERQLSKTLYMVVQDKLGWKLPTFGYKLGQEEPLHSYAEAGIRSQSASDVNLYTVSKSPVHVLKYNDKQQLTQDEPASKEYVIKSHIVAGEFLLAKTAGFKDYLWLTKQELKQYLPAPYFEEIEFLLADY